MTNQSNDLADLAKKIREAKQALRLINADISARSAYVKEQEEQVERVIGELNARLVEFSMEIDEAIAKKANINRDIILAEEELEALKRAIAQTEERSIELELVYKQTALKYREELDELRSE